MKFFKYLFLLILPLIFISCEKIEIEDIMRSEIKYKNTIIESVDGLNIGFDVYVIQTENGNLAKMVVGEAVDYPGYKVFCVGLYNGEEEIKYFTEDDYYIEDLNRLYEYLDSIPPKEPSFEDVYFDIIEDVLTE